MAKPLDPTLVKILTEYGENPRDAAWDCHGTWVVYHKAIERIAAKAGITFDMPEIVEAKASEKIVTILVRGFLEQRSEWSFGEAAPSNNKNAYVYAMAEKRAKDRVVLKLVGLHGLAYSEDESDDFKPDARKSSASLKKQDANGDDAWNSLLKQLHADFTDCKSVVTLSKLRADYRENARNDGWPKAWLEALKDEFDSFEDTLPKADDGDFPGDRPNAYVDAMRGG